MLNKRALQRLGHVSRPANVSSRSRLEIWTSRLGLVSVTAVSCPSLPTDRQTRLLRP